MMESCVTIDQVGIDDQKLSYMNKIILGNKTGPLPSFFDPLKVPTMQRNEVVTYQTFLWSMY